MVYCLKRKLIDAKHKTIVVLDNLTYFEITVIYTINKNKLMNNVK